MINGPCLNIMEAYGKYDAYGQYAVDIMEYSKHGYVESGPLGFIMAKPVISMDSQERILSHFYDPKESDAWYVHWYSGSVPEGLERILSRLPFSYRKIGWTRSLKGRKKVCFYPMARMKSLLINKITRNLWEKI